MRQDCTCCVQADCQILVMENPNNSDAKGNCSLSNKLPLLQVGKNTSNKYINTTSESK